MKTVLNTVQDVWVPCAIMASLLWFTEGAMYGRLTWASAGKGVLWSFCAIVVAALIVRFLKSAISRRRQASMKNGGDDSRPSEWLSADRPIEKRKEDMLDRAGFSEALAGAICGWSGRESLVLALYGAWGSGKSSVKNMLIECLCSDSPEIPILDFNPWQLANRPALSEAFFDELGVALGKGDLGSPRQRRSVLAKYKRWAHRLQGGRDLIQAFRNLFGVLLVFLGAVTIGAAWIGSRAIPVFLGILLLFAGVLAFLSNLFGAVIKFLEAGTDVGARAISEVKAEIAGDLKKLKTPILVILDDLDRLTPRETLEVLQLIKANCDFPNLTYLILCERSVVEGNVGKALNVSGRDYLEKIVQVAFDVPMIDLARVHQVLFQRLGPLLSPEAVSSRFSKKRWTNVFLSGLRPYFSTLRDVNRFMSTLAFQFSSFHADGAFEVNPIDLITLEAIRLYEPEAYRQLRRNKEILTTNSRPQGPLADATQRTVAGIVETADDDRRSQLRELIKHLFPTIEWALEGPQYADDYGDQWYRDLRVCSKKVFDRYFRLTLAEDEISQAAVQRLVRARGDRERLRSELESLNSSGLLKAALEELAVNQESVTSEEAEPYITAIFDVADALSDEAKGMLELPAAWRVAFLARNALKKLDDPARRLKTLIGAISSTKGLYMAVEFVVLIETPPNSGGEPPMFSEEDITRAKLAAVSRIKSAAASGVLAKHPRLALLLGTWRSWGKSEDVTNYLGSLIETKDGTLQLLRSLVLRSLRQGLGDYVAEERYFIRRNDIDPLISMDTLDAKVQELLVDTLGDEDRRAVNAFKKAMERRRAGKPDDGPFVTD